MRAVMLGVLVLITVWAYSPTWTAPFVYEDTVYVQAALVPQPWSSYAGPRTATALSFRVNALLDGTEPRGYHAVNVLIHLITGMALGVVARRLWRSEMAGWLVAGVFLLHPFQTQAVAYVAGRSELIAGLGVVLALVAISKPLTGWRSVGLIAALALAVGGKETGLMGVGLAGLYAALIAKHRVPRWLVPVGVLLCLVIVTRSLVGNDYIGASQRGGLGYLAMQATAMWRYLGLVIWPVGQTLDHDFDLVPKWLALVGMQGLILSTGVLWIVRHRWPAVSFAGLAVIVALLPRFFVRIPEYLHEHQFYVPMVGVCLLIGGSVMALERVKVAWQCFWRGHVVIRLPEWRGWICQRCGTYEPHQEPRGAHGR